MDLQNLERMEQGVAVRDVGKQGAGLGRERDILHVSFHEYIVRLLICFYCLTWI